MSASMPWVKLYTEFIDDPKFADVTDSVKLRFVQLVLLAGECDRDGALLSGDAPMTVQALAWRLRVPADQLKNEIAQLVTIGVLSVDNDTYALCKFGKRQGRSQEDKRTQWRERQAKTRAKISEKPEKTAVPEPVTQAEPPFGAMDKMDVTRESRVSHAPRERVRVRVRQVQSTPKGSGETEKFEQAKTAGATAPRPRDVIFDAVAEVTKSNPALQGSHIAKVANRLREIGATPEQIKRFGQWFAICDFRGLKGDAPMLENVMQLWQRSVEWDGARPKLPAGAPPRSNGRTFARGQVQYTDEQRKAAEERARRELAGEEVE